MYLFLFILVILDIPTYLRDILYLPLYGDRILFINIYLLLIGLLMLFCNKSNITHTKELLIKYFGNYFLIFVLFTFIFSFTFTFVQSLLNPPFSFTYSLQILIFLIALFYSLIILKNNHLKLLLKYLLISLFSILVIQIIFKGFSLYSGIIGEFSANKNSLSYVAFTVLLINRLYFHDNNKKYLFLLISITDIINQTKAVFILLVIYFAHNLLKKYFYKFSNFKNIYILLFFSLLILFTYFGLELFLYIVGIPVHELEALESQRWNVPDSLGSAISRLGSVSYTIDKLILNLQIFGFGVNGASEILYWGYPVHNYYVYSLSVSGIVGLFYSIMLFFLSYLLSSHNIMLGFISLFYLSVSNDLSLILILCFLPIYINNLKLFPRFSFQRIDKNIEESIRR